MRGSRRRIVAFAATMALVLPLWAGGGTAQGGVPSHPTRVLIVLFDQMLPQYANQFDMPNFRELRNAGTNFKKAYLGYMASETVIAHNVITSGQLPKHMGWTDEAYRDADNLLGKGAGEMHITGDLSLRRLRHADRATTGGLSEARRLPARRRTRARSSSSSGEKSYAVESATAPNGDASACGCPSRSSSTLFDSCGATLRRSVPVPVRHERAELPRADLLRTRAVGTSSTPTRGNNYGTTAAFPSWMYPEDGNRFFPGTDAVGAGGAHSVATPGWPTPRSR